MPEEREERYIVKIFKPSEELKKTLYELGAKLPIDIVEVESEKADIEPKICLEGPCGTTEIHGPASKEVILSSINSIKCKTKEEETKESPETEATSDEGPAS